ncbi:hypothetical protein [Ereboglobus sp. PH5-10]|uniref:hypothetical protein n=1 Tax=Ereboglobus sp. PH5-10 TaxID=2940629 RepID=UPI002406A041|nr:hypothetical protein [Ereboglobus sp. PH5-10]
MSYTLFMLVFTGCVSCETTSNHGIMIHAKIEILTIKKQHWVDNLGPKILARGDYLVQVRFLGPERYQGEVADIPLVNLSDMVSADNIQLQAGDIVEFDTSEKMLTGAAKPYVFTNFKNVKKVTKKR